MKILALDPGTRTGWAHSSDAHGNWDLSVKRDESGGMRLIRFRGKLEEIRRNAGVDLLVYEAPRYAGDHLQSVAFQGELQGVIKIWCEEHRIEYRAYSPSEIKKHATGKGNASKESVALAAYRKWGEATGYDESDARWLLDLAQRDLGIQEAA